MKRTLIIFALALPFIVALTFFILSKRPAPIADLPLPNPNGYDKFIQAGTTLKGDAELYESMSQTDLMALITDNAESLALVRSAFTNECRVPVNYSVSYLSAHLNDLTALKKLGQMMMAEGRLAELKHDPDKAAKVYLDTIHLSIESGRGGFMADAVLGKTFERFAEDRLNNLTNSLDESSSRMVAFTLESLDTDRPNLEDALRNEDILIRRLSPGWKTFIGELVMYKQWSHSKKEAEKNVPCNANENFKLGQSVFSPRLRIR